LSQSTPVASLNNGVVAHASVLFPELPAELKASNLKQYLVPGFSPVTSVLVELAARIGGVEASLT